MFGKERVALKDHAHVATLSRYVGDVISVDEHPPGVGSLEARENSQRGGLAAARWTEQRHELSGRNVEREPVERGRRAEAAREVVKDDGGTRLG